MFYEHNTHKYTIAMLCNDNWCGKISFPLFISVCLNFQLSLAKSIWHLILIWLGFFRTIWEISLLSIKSRRARGIFFFFNFFLITFALDINFNFFSCRENFLLYFFSPIFVSSRNIKEKILFSSLRIGNNRCTIRFEIIRAVSYRIAVKI